MDEGEPPARGHRFPRQAHDRQRPEFGFDFHGDVGGVGAADVAAVRNRLRAFGDDLDDVELQGAQRGQGRARAEGGDGGPGPGGDGGFDRNAALQEFGAQLEAEDVAAGGGGPAEVFHQRCGLCLKPTDFFHKCSSDTCKQFCDSCLETHLNDPRRPVFLISEGADKGCFALECMQCNVGYTILLEGSRAYDLARGVSRVVEVMNKYEECPSCFGYTLKSDFIACSEGLGCLNRVYEGNGGNKKICMLCVTNKIDLNGAKLNAWGNMVQVQCCQHRRCPGFYELPPVPPGLRTKIFDLSRLSEQIRMLENPEIYTNRNTLDLMKRCTFSVMANNQRIGSCNLCVETIFPFQNSTGCMVGPWSCLIFGDQKPSMVDKLTPRHRACLLCGGAFGDLGLPEERYDTNWLLHHNHWWERDSELAMPLFNELYKNKSYWFAFFGLKEDEVNCFGALFECPYGIPRKCWLQKTGEHRGEPVLWPKTYDRISARQAVAEGNEAFLDFLRRCLTMLELYPQALIWILGDECIEHLKKLQTMHDFFGIECMCSRRDSLPNPMDCGKCNQDVLIKIFVFYLLNGHTIGLYQITAEQRIVIVRSKICALAFGPLVITHVAQDSGNIEMEVPLPVKYGLNFRLHCKEVYEGWIEKETLFCRYEMSVITNFNPKDYLLPYWTTRPFLKPWGFTHVEYLQEHDIDPMSILRWKALRRAQKDSDLVNERPSSPNHRHEQGASSSDEEGP